jgi:hypothetical protein
VGFVRTEDQRIEIIPDRQVQEAIRGVFRKFRDLGSARQTMLWYCTENVMLPERNRGKGDQETTWHLPNRMRILQILQNPCYAGAFAWGKTGSATVVREGRAQRGGRRRKPMGQWKVFIQDHHVGYISWQEFLENQQMLRANRTNNEPASGAARQGTALLPGLLRCARCGHKLFTRYGGVDGNVPRYVCRGDRRNYPVPTCVSVGGLRIDQAVAAAVLEAIQPAGIQASLTAMDQLQRREDEQVRAVELALEKARYEVQRACRQYDTVDPENRLVASELEARWNKALEQTADLEGRLTELQQRHCPLTDAERAQLLELGSDLNKLWRHAGTSTELKKRILRTVLREIVLVVHTDPPRNELRLHWQGGVHTTLTVNRNSRGKHGKATNMDVLELIRELSKICDDREIARTLNLLGHRTGKGNTWQASRIADVRNHYRLPSHEAGRNWVSMLQAATKLGVSTTVIQRLIAEGKLPATQVVKCAPWVIERSSLELPAIQAEIASLRTGRRRPLIHPAQRELPLDS